MSLCLFVPPSVHPSIHTSVGLFVNASMQEKTEESRFQAFIASFWGKVGGPSLHVYVPLVICPSICATKCLSIGLLYIPPSALLSVRMSIQVKTDECRFQAFFASYGERSICASLCPSVHRSDCPYILLYIPPSALLSVHASVRWSVHTIKNR